MFNYKRIAIGFGLVICLMIALGGVSLFQMRNIANDVDQIYRHPFAVSNAAKSIDYHLVSIQRYMKDVATAEDRAQIEVALVEVDEHEAEALKNFQIIFERFLGDKSQIEIAYQLFIDWKVIRSDVIRMANAGERTAARMVTKVRGTRHVEALNVEVDKLTQFAFNKAEEFHVRAQLKKKKALTHIFLLTMAAVILAVLIAVYVMKNTLKLRKERTQRLHLIDQNIMMATLDMDGVVLEVSNALCRFLGNTKEELIGTPSNFFDNSDEGSETVHSILQTVQTGQNWKGEIKRFGSDGRIYWASSSVIPNSDDEFEVTGYTNILVDTTSKKLSVTDKLTTLYNRRRYEEIIVRELRLAKRNDHDMTLAMIDIDFFKKYNDHYGHPKGDVVLSKVAECLLSHLKRPNDYAFRMGGEEFALVFSGLNVLETETFLEDVRASIEGLEIEHGGNSVSDYLTISLGAQVVHPNSMIDEERAYILSDKALYMAKATRNTVVVTS